MFVRVVLHDLKDIDLVEFERLVVAINQKSEKVQQFGLVERVGGFGINNTTNLFDKLHNGCLIEQHCLVVVIHFFEEIDATHILFEVRKDQGDIFYQRGFNSLVVPYQAH